MKNDGTIVPSWQAWTAPKQGNPPDRNEDAFRVEPLANPNGLLIAVADGATEAVYSGAWARHLVEAAQPDWPNLSDEELRTRIDAARRSFSPLDLSAPVPWYVRNKFLMQGSQATLLVASVVALQEPRRVAVDAVAVGDCLLLLLRASGAAEAFPVGRSGDFGLNPALIVNRHQESLRFNRWQGHARPGDLLLFFTDALGKWALECIEMGRADLLLGTLLELFEGEPAGDDRRSETGSTAAMLDTSPAGREQDEGDPIQDRLAWERLWEFLRSLGVAWRELGREGEAAKSSPQAARAPEALDHSETKTPAPSLPIPTPDQIPVAGRFEQFVQAYRLPGAVPRLRDDDATCVACFPVWDAGREGRAEAVQVLRRHLHDLERRPLTVRVPDK